jgi:transcriptional regulator with XRE-family HTH domain
MELGKRIRMLRLEQSRTQAEIAARCGFTVSLLSKIENNQTTPPVATLMKIADSLGVKIADLLSQDGQAANIFTSGSQHLDPASLIKTDNGYSFFAFASARSEKAMQPYLFVARRGEVKTNTFSHHGEEFIYLLEGEMRYRVGAVEYTMKAGDSIYFNSLEEHSLMPVSEEVKYLAVFSEAGKGSQPTS